MKKKKTRILFLEMSRAKKTWLWYFHIESGNVKINIFQYDLKGAPLNFVNFEDVYLG